LAQVVCGCRTLAAATTPFSALTSSDVPACPAFAICQPPHILGVGDVHSESQVIGGNFGPSNVGDAFGSRPLHFARIEGSKSSKQKFCSCVHLDVCPCKPHGNLIGPAPEFVTPKEKKMITPKSKKVEMVAPKRKASRDDLGNPIGRKQQTRMGCGCRKLVEAMLMAQSDCHCHPSPPTASACCTVEPCQATPPCAGRLLVAAVHRGVRTDVVKLSSDKPAAAAAAFREVFEEPELQ